jgi:hypothetical protein
VHRLSVGSEVSMIPSGYTDETIFTDYISLRLIRFYATVYFMRYVFDFIRRDLFHFMRRNVVRARVLRGVFYWVGPRSAFLTCGSLCPTGGVRWLEKFLVTYLLHAGSSTESSENKYILVKLLFCIGGALHRWCIIILLVGSDERTAHLGFLTWWACAMGRGAQSCRSMVGGGAASGCRNRSAERARWGLH